jgi:glycosyltransferase involved in cell wall biosynthesis
MPLYRVLVVTNMWPHEADPSYGGFVREQIESLRPLGVEYDVLFINGRLSRWNYARGVPELRRRLRSNPYDLIHAHFGLSGWVARFQFKVPLVVTFHGDDVLGKFNFQGRITPLGRFFQLTSFIVARFASAVIVQSREMRSVLRLNSAKVIPCGIDLHLFRPTEREEARKILGLDPAKKYVLFAYNPAEARKRYDLVKAAVERGREAVPELEILHVRGKPHAELPLYLSAADVVVIASMAEAGPLVTKEAIATHLPVISVNLGDVADLIGNNEGNYLVRRDVGEIAERIVDVCRRGIRGCARDRLAPFSMEATARKILEVYAEVARRPPRRDPPL